MKRRAIDWWIIGIIAVTSAIKAAFLFRPFFPWWDYGVYLGIGKYLFTFGQSGLLEPIRPPVWGILTGFFWWAGLPPVVTGRILEILFSAGAVYLSYLIAKKIFGRRTGIITASLFSGSSIFFFMGMRLYTEIPAVFFVLLSFYLLLRERWALGGVALGVAILTRFPSGIFILAFIPLVYGLRRFFRFGFGLALPIVPYLAVNVYAYGNPLFPVFEANRVISEVMSCNALWQNPWYFYLLRMFADNVFFIFLVPGTILLLMDARKRKDKGTIALLLSLALPLFYLTALDCRIYRYLIMVIPFIAMLSSGGIQAFIGTAGRRAWYAVFAVIFVVSLTQGVMYYLEQDVVDENPAGLAYYRIIPGEGEVWSANPLVTLFTDRSISMVYYPVYDRERALEFRRYLETEGEKVGTVYLDNCGGGIICPDQGCEEELEKTLFYLDETREAVYEAEWGRCWYKVYGELLS